MKAPGGRTKAKNCGEFTENAEAAAKRKKEEKRDAVYDRKSPPARFRVDKVAGRAAGQRVGRLRSERDAILSNQLQLLESLPEFGFWWMAFSRRSCSRLL